MVYMIKEYDICCKSLIILIKNFFVKYSYIWTILYINSKTELIINMFDQNIKYLENSRFHWISTEQSTNNLKYIIKENNAPIEYFQNNQQVIAIKDEYDVTQPIHPLLREVIIVIGINSILEIKEIIRKKNKESIILIFEPNQHFFQHVLNNKNLSLFNNEKVFLFADEKIENIPMFLREVILNINYIGLFKNIVVYLTAYYRQYEAKLTKELLNIIHQYIQISTIEIGNDVYDSVKGLKNNLNNLIYLKKAKKPDFFKNKYKGKPAVIVAAGPSLQKNIHHLKKYKNNIVIIAVDTILQRLLQEGIKPDFICSVERLPEVYDYFYKNAEIPKEVTLVGPLVLDSRIFDTYKGNYIIPFRMEVTEFAWLKEVLSISGDLSIPVGSSCAHMAFGVAEHLGCSPIIMIGQDLAYDTKTGKTHISGTSYDELSVEVDRTEDIEVIGYHGGKVKTTTIWNVFRHWFENEIINKDLFVINATEGGAKIHNTKQLTLEETLEAYATEQLIRPYKIVENSNTYEINLVQGIQKIKEELSRYQALKDKCKEYFYEVDQLVINEQTFMKKKFKLNTTLEKVHPIIDVLKQEQLIFHNTQSLIVTFLWEYNSLEQILNLETLTIKRNVVGRFIAAVSVAINEVEEALSMGISSLEGEIK